jgi:hypothetical protein
MHIYNLSDVLCYLPSFILDFVTLDNSIVLLHLVLNTCRRLNESRHILDFSSVHFAMHSAGGLRFRLLLRLRWNR